MRDTRYHQLKPHLVHNTVHYHLHDLQQSCRYSFRVFVYPTENAIATMFLTFLHLCYLLGGTQASISMAKPSQWALQSSHEPFESLPDVQAL